VASPAAGTLFGSEQTLVYPLDLLYQPTYDLILDYAILGRLRLAGQRALTEALQDVD